MGQQHYVVQGEYLSKIAHAYGFASYQTIWDAPENQELKEKRKNPNILYPGDKLFIPDKKTKEESRATEKRHRFEREGEKLMLRIALKDLANHPLKASPCTLHVETDSEELTTDSAGIIEQQIPHPEKTAQGLLDNRKADFSLPIERLIHLKIGELHPVTKVSGQMARLNNLGYDAGEVPEKVLSEPEAHKVSQSSRFRSAVEEFQCDFMGPNEVDGVCGEKTKAKLKEIHGC